MSVFIDIFNNLLKYNNQEVFIIVDRYNQIWFKLKDIVKILGYNDHARSVTRLNIDDENKIYYNKIKLLPFMAVPYNFQPTTIFIDEAGLYKLLSNSRKDIAKQFRDDVFGKILSNIRKTGKFSVEKNEIQKIKKLNKEIIQLKNNQRNIIYPEGKAIYVIKQTINNKKYYKIGYTSNLNKRLKVYNTGNANKLLYSYFCLITNDEIDKCIKKYMKDKEFIKNKEYYVTNVKDMIKIINNCNKKIKTISCGYCLKSKNIKNIAKHRCKYLL